MDEREDLIAEFVCFLGGIVFGALLMFAASPDGSQVEFEDPELYFKTNSTFERSIGVYDSSTGSGFVCNVDRRDEVQIDRSTFKYVNSTECSVVEEGFESWNNESFRDIYVYEEMKEVVGNESSS
ncbi:hypothetical protein ACM16X_02650 [Haloarcula japonica]|uniref:hypothetical protein n=1 Tax=Haloarcula japonica TaxID=29282 RepID=UPI0039F6B7A8